MKERTNILVYFLFISLFIIASNKSLRWGPLERLLEDPEIKCPSQMQQCSPGVCVYEICPTVETCKPRDATSTILKCPDGSCAEDIRECIYVKCDANLFYCWDGKCVKNYSMCSTATYCSSSYPTKCPDGSCVNSVNDCNFQISCPPYSPYKCATGECRRSAPECPTLITCPTTFSIKCPDQKCAKLQDSCTKSIELSICPPDQIYCPDGSCSKSKILCPTMSSCNPGEVRCWDSTCQKGVEDCPLLAENLQVCNDETPFHCPDGSCSQKLSECATRIICPAERPVFCDDGNCRETIAQCTTGTKCTAGSKRCPDGSCAGASETCGVSLKCPNDAPYKCFDGTCRADLRDCPIMPTCPPETPILCPNGLCVLIRDYCSPKRCPTSKPVLCPDWTCNEDSSKCAAISGCPLGRYLCDDGTCVSSVSQCKPKACPNQLRFLCDDGFCVSDLKYCDKPNYCTYNNPFKCADGHCVKNKELCLDTPVMTNNVLDCKKAKIENITAEYACPDGSCANLPDQCPLQNGCPKDSPLKCISGECINPNKTNCSIAGCPTDVPIKCLNGLCVKTTSACQSYLENEDFSICKNDPDGNIFPCANGRCVPSSDHCRPIFPCTNNQARCPDGSCRPSIAMCPKYNTSCPIKKPFRCSNGICAKNNESCSKLDNGCPGNAQYKCPNSGLCVQNDSLCGDFKSNIYLPNGCPLDTPIRCAISNNCSANQSSCPSLNFCKQNSTHPFMCKDFKCDLNAKACRTHVIGCKSTELKCPNGQCVAPEDYNKCFSTKSCSYTKPFYCADGQCVTNPFNPFSTESCRPTVQCPSYQPYICSNGECVGDPSWCQVQTQCPIDKPYRCLNLTCVAYPLDCSNQNKLCPITSPILCEDGRCVGSVIECQSAKSMYCDPTKPITCILGCQTTPSECIPENVRNAKVTTDSKKRTLDVYPPQNISQNISNITDDDSDTPFDDNSSTIDPGCNADAPKRCYDGSCRLNWNLCPIIAGCLDPSKPYRCLSGVCGQSLKECAKIDQGLGYCAEGFQRCEDGYCRLKCPRYDGCKLNKPLQCPNGFCGTNLGECAGESNCPVDKPFRCIEGSCVETIFDCARPLRSYKAETIQATVSSFLTNNIEFIYEGGSLIKFGKITIPAGSLLQPNLPTTSLADAKRNLDDTNSSTDDTSDAYHLIVITPVADSNIRHFINPIHDWMKYYTESFFPLTGGKLNYHQTVRSSVIRIQSLLRNDSSLPFRFPIVIQLHSDIVKGSNKKNDYCLGKLNDYNKTWECSSRSLLNPDDSSNAFAYPANVDGVYAVIFNPTPVPPKPEEQICDWFCENKLILLYGFLICLGVIIIFGYIFWRLSRYITKYRQAKVEMRNYQEQITELEKATTDVVGQTIEDKLKGIQFTENPSFKKEDDESKKEVVQLESQVDRLAKRGNILEKEVVDLNQVNKVLNDEVENLKKELNAMKATKNLETVDSGKVEETKEFE